MTENTVKYTVRHRDTRRVLGFVTVEWAYGKNHQAEATEKARARFGGTIIVWATPQPRRYFNGRAA